MSSVHLEDSRSRSQQSTREEHHLRFTLLGCLVPTTLGFSLPKVFISFTPRIVSIGALGFVLVFFLLHFRALKLLTIDVLKFVLFLCYKLPDGLDVSTKTYLNKGNIYIANTTPSAAVKVYQELFQMDVLLFLKLPRYGELVVGGQMVLAFSGFF